MAAVNRPRYRERGRGASRARPFQRRSEIRVLVHGVAGPRAVRHRRRDLEAYFSAYTTIKTQRVALLIHSLAAIAAILVWIVHVYAAIWVRGSVRGMTRGYVTPGSAWRRHRKWLRQLATTGSRGPAP